jgi:saccharopine dehydrogenase (NAD+, L-lysine-forming)
VFDLGLRREDKHEWERRVPLTPAYVAELVAKQGLSVAVQPSPIRIFDDETFRAAGATVQEDLGDCRVVFAVKEIPKELLRQGGAYVFFSHTIKGQSHNMPMLRRLVELGCTLIDYERIVDDQNRRLVFFGRHAGWAGMVDTLVVTGTRLRALGFGTPFESLELTHHYAGLQQAKQAVTSVGESIRRDGLPRELAPFVIGIAGYGNVGSGAHDIVDLLPTERIEPRELASLKSTANDRVFEVVFREEDIVEPIDPARVFALQHYYAHPEGYRGRFAQYLPHLSIVVNAIYWNAKYPRLVEKAALRELFAAGAPKLVSIGDIGCDLDGAVESTVKETTPGEPAYVWDPHTGTARDGYEGPGVVMMTTDCLPCELSKEASEAFTDALRPFVRAIATADYDAPDPSSLPAEIRRAVILWRGELTEPYRDLQKHV